MAPHSLGSGTISFGLVSIPIKMYTAASSGGVSFNQLHAKCGNRLRQQMICPLDNEVVDRSQIVKGYEFQKDQYVRFTDEEIKALEGEASKMIDITEFVPLSTVDPIYFEKTYYLGPDKGGEKGYALLAQAMATADEIALAKYAARGKSYLVLIRSTGDRLFMQQLYHSDEVRDIGEVPLETRRNSDAEVKLARQLIEQISSGTFKPEKYEDEVRKRVEALIAQKLGLSAREEEYTSLAPSLRR